MIEPYYEDDSIVLYHARCEDVMPELMDDFFDLVLTDPPYNEVNRKSNGLANLDREGADSELVDIPLVASHLARLSKGSIYVWCGMRQLSKWLDEFVKLGLSTRGGFWRKTNAMPMNAQHLWVSALEAVAFARHAGAFFDHPIAPLAFEGPTTPMTDVHPTAKPAWLFSMLMKASCAPGGMVLDPYAGSGTTLEAAKSLGYRAVGIEVNEKYCETIANRVSAEVMF